MPLIPSISPLVCRARSRRRRGLPGWFHHSSEANRRAARRLAASASTGGRLQAWAGRTYFLNGMPVESNDPVLPFFTRCGGALIFVAADAAVRFQGVLVFEAEAASVTNLTDGEERIARKSVV